MARVPASPHNSLAPMGVFLCPAPHVGQNGFQPWFQQLLTIVSSSPPTVIRRGGSQQDGGATRLHGVCRVGSIGCIRSLPVGKIGKEEAKIGSFDYAAGSVG